MDSTGIILVAISVAILLCTVIGCIAYLYFGRLWFRAHVKGCPVSLGRLVSMTFQGANAYRIVNALVEAHLAGIEVSLEDLEEHDRGRGKVRSVVGSMIRAKAAGSELSFDEARKLDMQGKEFAGTSGGVS